MSYERRYIPIGRLEADGYLQAGEDESITGTFTFETGPRLENSVYLQGENNAGGTFYDLIGVNSSDWIEFGDPTRNVQYDGALHKFANPIESTPNGFTSSTAAINFKSSLPTVFWENTSAGADEGLWNWQLLTDGTLRLQTRNDAESGGAVPLRLLRTGTTVDEIELTATLLDFNGNADFSGTITAVGVIKTTSGSANNQFAVHVESAVPGYSWKETGVTADNSVWAAWVNTEQWRLGLVNDAGNSFQNVISVDRTGQTADEVEIRADRVALNGSVGLTGRGIITPSITADQDDWNPSGLATAALIFVQGNSVAERTISGIQAPAVDGKFLYIYNQNSFNLIIEHEGSGSQATNRFFCAGGVDLSIGARGGAMFIYTGERWRGLQP